MSDFTEENERWILRYESGRNWVSKLPSKDTKRIFIRCLDRYCKAVKMNPDELIAFKIDGLRNVATETEFQAERLLEKYLANVNLTQSMKEMQKNAIISFYKHNWRNLNPNVASNIEKPEAKKRTPKIEDIQSLEANTTNSRDKAIIWFFASTAVRIGTFLKLKWSDLQPTNDIEVPYSLTIESNRLKGAGIGKFKGLKQITFIHKLAAEKLEAYKAEATRKGYKFEESSPIFIGYKNKKVVKPITQPAVNQVYDNASLSAWKDLETKRFSPHDNRDFIQTQLENAGVNANIIAPIMAHKPRNAVDSHYSSHDVSELLGKYKSALNYLLPVSVEKVKSELDTTKQELTATQKKYENLEDKFVMQLAEKQKETMQAIHRMLQKQGLKVEWEESGEEP